MELIGIIKNEKLRLQDHLALLEQRVEQVRLKIGLADGQF